ncbi:MAG: class I SAM-dependent rRNA methyltransferase [Acholeplasmatales bacterium]|jgi:23S rRNA (cytosine1962-C5)-methyltransferase|nr:class I SAM-dependent rRNA methyltransferase [Acholeplasmatales bacterium]
MTKFIISHKIKDKVLQTQKVFANDIISCQERDLLGVLCLVYTDKELFIGTGYYNFLSKIIIRLISNQIISTPKLTFDFFYERLENAWHRKTSLAYQNTFRLIYDENDLLPGLIVDKYQDSLVMQISTLGMEEHKEIITQALVKLFNPLCIYNRSDIDIRTKEGLPLISECLYGQPRREIIEENGLKLIVDYQLSNKTGYYLDQQANHQKVQKYALNRDCLDLFCNEGGFALNLAQGGAKSILAVDIAENALNLLKENIKLNRLTNIQTLQGDCFTILKDYKKQGYAFDLIVLDPPSMSHSFDKINEAIKGYIALNKYALELLNAGGILVSCSCTGHLSLNSFINVLKEASLLAHAKTNILEVAIQGADHGALLTNDFGIYLKTIILQKII